MSGLIPPSGVDPPPDEVDVLAGIVELLEELECVVPNGGFGLLVVSDTLKVLESVVSELALM